MRIHLFGLSILAIVLSTHLHAQGDKEIMEFKLNDIQAIMEGDSPTGYFTFFKNKDAKGKEIVYFLRILDKDANLIAENEIIGSKDFHLVAAASSSGIMAFKFFDTKKKVLVMKFYNRMAEEINTQKFELDKTQQRMLSSSIKEPMYKRPSFFAIGHKGFLNVRLLVSGMGFGYEVDFFDNHGDVVWTAKSDQKEKESQSLSFLGSTDDLIYFARGKGRKAEDTRIIGLSVSDGNETFESSHYEFIGKERLVLNFFFDEGNSEMISLGLYVEKNDEGLIFSRYDLNGELKAESKINWESELSDFEDNGAIFFHDIQNTAAGGYIAIGEHFQMKNRFSIGDIYVFELNNELKLINVQRFEKEANKYDVGSGSLLIGGSSFGSGAFFGSIAKNLGWYDYSHVLSTGESYTAYYANNSKANNKGDNTIGKIVKEGDGYKRYQNEVSSGADLIKVLPAQGESILLFEYFEKEKELKNSFIEID